jgi:hypothetical protein
MGNTVLAERGAADGRTLTSSLYNFDLRGTLFEPERVSSFVFILFNPMLAHSALSPFAWRNRPAACARQATRRILADDYVRANARLLERRLCDVNKSLNDPALQPRDTERCAL